MANSTGFDYGNSDYCSQPRGFLTPPPTWKRNRCSSVTAMSEKKPKPKGDLFHVVHKIPSGDSPYVRAKHVQLVDKNPSKAVSLFWAAINSGDRVDSALKDMAVVMKQLDRSDEAIEAIKSFRHLSPPDSQESIDNILVELYKQSGRIEEEIEMLRRKVKQVEEGIAFSGKRTKMARSQGKKVQITVEKEYSRLLGNLAWAYMQHKDFKSAEENYKIALSFEPDKNKQCNLAICLMHMSKLTEAKFLLQTVRFSPGKGNVDESYAKSYERASEILAEFESQNQTAQNDGNLTKAPPFGGQWDSMTCSQKNSDDDNDIQSAPLPLPAKMNSGAFTEFPHEKRADFYWRRNHYEPRIRKEEANEFPCYRNIPKVPYTQPRRCLRSGGHQRKGGVLGENAYDSYCRKLSFGSFENRNIYYSTASPTEMPEVIPQLSEKQFSLKDEANLNLQAVSGITCKISMCEHKSWADMVEEDEQQEGWSNDENVDSNVIQETPKFHDEAEQLCQKMELIDLGSGYFTQPEKSLMCSLCFDQNHSSNIQNDRCTSPLMTKVLNFEGQVEGLSEDLGSGNNRKRRLQVFQDITSTAGSTFSCNL